MIWWMYFIYSTTQFFMGVSATPNIILDIHWYTVVYIRHKVPDHRAEARILNFFFFFFFKLQCSVHYY
jgi:hypothetical protein